MINRQAKSGSEQEKKVARNVVSSLAITLQDLSVDFRKAQSSYLKSKRRGGGVEGREGEERKTGERERRGEEEEGGGKERRGEGGEEEGDGRQEQHQSLSVTKHLNLF